MRYMGRLLRCSFTYIGEKLLGLLGICLTNYSGYPALSQLTIQNLPLDKKVRQIPLRKDFIMWPRYIY